MPKNVSTDNTETSITVNSDFVIDTVLEDNYEYSGPRLLSDNDRNTTNTQKENNEE